MHSIFSLTQLNLCSLWFFLGHFWRCHSCICHFLSWLLQYYVSTLRPVQLIQIYAACLSYYWSKPTHITSILSLLYLLPIKYCTQFKILMITFKILNSPHPTYLFDFTYYYSTAKASFSIKLLLFFFPLAPTFCTWEIDLS